MMTLLWSLLFASYISSAEAFGIREKENPIRRIVTLLQEMQKEIETEGEKEEEAFEKFMCYCPLRSSSLISSLFILLAYLLFGESLYFLFYSMF